MRPHPTPETSTASVGDAKGSNLMRLSKTTRMTLAESAAAYLSDLWNDTWEHVDGMWQNMPVLDAGPASWGIDPAPIRRSDDWIMAEARREGWEG